MSRFNPAVDAYIERSAAFAKPVLLHLRELVHATCPDVEEKMKWSFPHFDYKGQMMCNFASFKQHCTFGFWKASLMPDPHGVLTAVGDTAMGNFGRIQSLDDLPPDEVIAGFIRAHMELNDAGIKVARPVKTAEKKEMAMPADLADALAGNPAAQSTFDGFSYSNRKDYLEWIEEAKSDATRAKRIVQAIEWMAEGKIRNWKYVKPKA